MNTIAPAVIQFDLPQELSCPKPTEERDLARDGVRLLVSTSAGEIEHSTFQDFPSFLREGDVLAVNTSATIPAALSISLPGKRQGRLHLSTKSNTKEWLVEIREVMDNKTKRWHEGEEGMTFPLPGGGSVTLKQRFYKNDQWLNLWYAAFNIQQPMQQFLAINARPIQYEKLDRQYPLSYYQTYFSFHPGSSEMPSAARGFTSRLVDRLLKKGIILAPVLLHTGVSSLEENETPYPEYMEIDPVAASILNAARDQGRRIVAVGTTVIRAIETATNEKGLVLPFRGNTELYIDENYRMKVIDGLLTGFHEPRASHLNMLQSVGGFEHIDHAYREAIKARYQWHQFGDLHLIM